MRTHDYDGYLKAIHPDLIKASEALEAESTELEQDINKLTVKAHALIYDLEKLKASVHDLFYA